MPIARIRASELDEWLSQRPVGPVRRIALRRSVVQLWRFARSRNYVPDKTTEAERTTAPKVPPPVVTPFSPEALEAYLGEVEDQYLPVLLFGAFAGIRAGELCPRGSKRPLMWEDVVVEQAAIRVEAATAKTSKPRIVPIAPNLESWLASIDPPAMGRIAPLRDITALGPDWPVRGPAASRGDRLPLASEWATARLWHLPRLCYQERPPSLS